MSGDHEPVIQTIGSIGRHDQAELSEKVTEPADNVPLKVLDNKLDDIKSRKEENQDDTVTTPRTHNENSSASASSEPDVVGAIRTVGNADPTDGNAMDGRREETKHGE